MCGFQEVDPQASTEPLSEGDSGEARLEGEVASLEDMFPMDHEVAPEPTSPSVRHGPTGGSQLGQRSLAGNHGGWKAHGRGNSNHLPHFSIKKKLLCQVVKKNDECMVLLLVPRPFVPSVLQFAHSHLLGVHLGVEKTLDQIKARLKRAMEDYCCSCQSASRWRLNPI